MQFHRRNISEIVMLSSSTTNSSNTLQNSASKAHTSPEKKPVFRRDELNKQFEKLKNNSITIAQKN